MARRKHLTDSRLPRASRTPPPPLRSHLGPMKETRLWRVSSARSSPFSNTYLLHYPAFTVCRHDSAPSTSKRRKKRRFCVAIFMKMRRRTHLGCLYFVSRTAAPPFEIRQHFTLFPVHAGMHLAPPLLCNYGGCGGKKEGGKGARRQVSDNSQQPDRPDRCSFEPREVFRLAMTAAS